MEVKLEFLRKGLSGDIWGLIDSQGMVVRQYPASSGEEALEFFTGQSESLRTDDQVSAISFGEKVVHL